MGAAEGKVPISLKQREFTLKQFAKWMGHSNYSAFNKWKKLRVAGFLEKMDCGITRGHNNFYQLQDEPLHREIVVEDIVVIFENRLLLDPVHTAGWNQWQCIESVVKKCASPGKRFGKQRRQSIKQQVKD